MLRRFIALAAAGIALALAASFYVRGLTQAEIGPKVVSAGSGEGLTPVSNSQNLPDDDYIAYRHVFAYIYYEAHRKEKPNQGINAAIELYRSSVPLNEEEANALTKIALETETHTLAIEEQAATIIKRFRENLDVELKSGRKPSPEPPELKTLQKQRVGTTLQGKDQLRKAFGEATFSRFDKFLKESLNIKVEKAGPSAQTSEGILR